MAVALKLWKMVKIYTEKIIMKKIILLLMLMTINQNNLNSVEAIIDSIENDTEFEIEFHDILNSSKSITLEPHETKENLDFEIDLNLHNKQSCISQNNSQFVFNKKNDGDNNIFTIKLLTNYPNQSTQFKVTNNKIAWLKLMNVESQTWIIDNFNKQLKIATLDHTKNDFIYFIHIGRGNNYLFRDILRCEIYEKETPKFYFNIKIKSEKNMAYAEITEIISNEVNILLDLKSEELKAIMMEL